MIPLDQSVGLRVPLVNPELGVETLRALACLGCLQKHLIDVSGVADREMAHPIYDNEYDESTSSNDRRADLTGSTWPHSLVLGGNAEYRAMIQQHPPTAPYMVGPAAGNTLAAAPDSAWSAGLAHESNRPGFIASQTAESYSMNNQNSRLVAPGWGSMVGYYAAESGLDYNVQSVQYPKAQQKKNKGATDV